MHFCRLDLTDLIGGAPNRRVPGYLGFGTTLTTSILCDVTLRQDSIENKQIKLGQCLHHAFHTVYCLFV